ncbi:copper resistance D family protein [Roseovarius sp. 217]|uniref:copper resistance D family protein n=1 Tax=Roseovarius sp. (strain 217) TaxID=314264 RepID=UPI0000688045|nr:CopD family protein [Roseovarius sp. 217]EAQ23079.1 Putative copper export protein [Roseovarius sp. 217]
MLYALSSADGVTWLSICVKVMVYASTLLAAGSVLAVLFLRSLPEAEQHRLRQMAVLMAIAAAILSLLRLPIRASFLMGGTWAGATEPMMLNMVMNSPLGTAIALRLIGLALLLAIMSSSKIGQGAAALGTVLVAASFAMRGHALEEPRLVLGLLITAHILGLAFWIGAFLPLLRLSKQSEPQITGKLAEEFGRKALWVVGGLVIAGLATLLIVTGGQLALLTSAYSQFFAIKLALFAGVVGLAAWNKLRLTPALEQDAPDAATRMSRSLKLESILLVAILLITAALSTVSAPERTIAATTTKTMLPWAASLKTNVLKGSA